MSENSDVCYLIENELSQKFGQKVFVKSSSALGGGCINHASRIATNLGDFFIKWNDNCAEDIFLREAESLLELKKASGNEVYVPDVFVSKTVDSTPGFLVMEYLEPGSLFKDSDEKLGRGLALIHQYQNLKFGFYNNNYCGATIQNNLWVKNWPEFYRDQRLSFLLELIQKERPLPAHELNIYQKLLTKISELLPNDAEPGLIHGDLWSGNYMMSKKGPALIDPASYYADREMEFGIITMFGGFSKRFYAAYNEIYPLAPDWKARNGLYQLFHVLNHYYLFGGGYRQQALRIAESYL